MTDEQTPQATRVARFTPASFWRRLAALVIDVPFVVAVLAVEVVAVAIATAPLLLLLGGSGRREEAISQLIGIAALILGPVVYYGTLESSRWQATVGKRIVGILVVNGALSRPSFGEACRRTLAKWLSAYPSFAGFFVAFIRDDRAAFHDSVTGTRVVRRVR